MAFAQTFGEAQRFVTPVEGGSLSLGLDGGQVIVDTEESCREILGLEPGELLGRNLGEIPELAPLSPLVLKGFCFKGVPLTVRGRRYLGAFVPAPPDGGTLLLQAPGEDGADVPDFLQSIDPLADITYDGIIMVDREGKIALVNQAFADLLGLQAAEMVGRHVHESYPNSALSRLPEVMETGRAEIGEPHLLNGRQVVVSRWPLVRGGRTVGALGRILFRDVREVAVLADKLQARAAKSSTAPAGGRQDFKYEIHGIICRGPAMKTLKEKLLRIALRPSGVLLLGESGTGKELFAHALHAASPRRHAPFVRVNCAAIPEHLLESELFGYAEGAFTGARKGGQSGKFEQACGGTIFLDEISEMSISMQAKLLRVLQEKEVTPLGTHGVKPIDVRVIAASNADLNELVKGGKFRADLYYRLNVVALTIPPLRERPEDIYLLVRHFIEQLNAEFGLQVQGLDTQAWAALRAYDFPGNVRELRCALESAFNLVTGPFVRVEDLPPPVARAAENPARVPENSIPADLAGSLGRQSLQEIMEEIERRIIEKSLEQVRGNKLNAAALLGISRPGLYKKLQKYNLH